MCDEKKVIIVEGLTDKKQLEKIITEEVDIIVTHGTFSLERFDELLVTYDLDDREVIILVDADRSGKQLRKQLTSQLPHATHIFIPEVFKEVATTPLDVLANELLKKHMKVDHRFLGLDGLLHD